MSQLTHTTPQTGPGTGEAAEVILEIRGVSKEYKSADGSPLPVLDNVSFDLRKGEIVALLGRSGAGKSTLLRCIAGLITPTSGQVLYRGKPVTGANPGVAMVFQTFALLPWLTVLKNVEIGLQAKGMTPAQCRDKATREIDRIGLDGFESAYPKELSGGMQQRVGFARALAVEPDALLLDEPFSALDVLTEENLRTELLRLWATPGFPTQAMLIVTHNLEEAVSLADRIFVLGTNPGQAAPATAPGTAPADTSPRDTPLPDASVGAMAGLLQILGLATAGDTGIKLTDDGRSFAAGDIDTAKSIFARQARARAPLVRAICDNLAAASDGTLGDDFFLDILRGGFSGRPGAPAAGPGHRLGPLRRAVRIRRRHRPPPTRPSAQRGPQWFPLVSAGQVTVDVNPGGSPGRSRTGVHRGPPHVQPRISGRQVLAMDVDVLAVLDELGTHQLPEVVPGGAELGWGCRIQPSSCAR